MPSAEALSPFDQAADTLDGKHVFQTDKRFPELAQLKLCLQPVQASHHLTKVRRAVPMSCLALIISTQTLAHGQTLGPASACPTKAQCQINRGPTYKKRAIDLTIDSAKKTRFRLPKGVTSFVIPVPSSNQARCFTLENEDVATKGTLSIATANTRLAVNDANWNVVAGAVRFRQKREFYLSLVGVEAKFVRLTFQIDRLGRATQPN